MALVALSGCGYQLAGRGALPGNVQTIGIKMLANRSMETGAEAIVTNALSDELNRRRPGTLKRVIDADAVMSGVIDAINRKTVSRAGTLTASQRRVSVTLSLTLKDRSGKILWQRSRLTAQGDYTVVAGNNTTTENNRREAIFEAAQLLAEGVYRALTDDF